MLEKEGGTRAALIDVGGFLGIGEKTVAIPFDELQFSQAGRSDRAEGHGRHDARTSWSSFRPTSRGPAGNTAAVEQPTDDATTDNKMAG